MRAHPKVKRNMRQKRVECLHRKKQKLDILEALIEMYEQSLTNVTYLRELKRRANQVRNQLKVLSTIEVK